MKYYFNIASIHFIVESEFEILWNSFIKKFIVSPFDRYDAYYKIYFSNQLVPEGKLINKGLFQSTYMKGIYESRLHHLIGFDEPSMLYRETDDYKEIIINEKYKEEYLKEDNHTIFNALAFEKLLINYKSIILHCSYIMVDGKAILFSAPSGTGKSTQADLWAKYKRAKIINGDRAIIQKRDGKYYACGMPICGSSNICFNEDYPIEAIVYLQQSPENHVYEVNKRIEMKRILSETTINDYNPLFINDAFDIISDLVMNVPMYHLECTKYKEAVECLDKELKK